MPSLIEMAFPQASRYFSQRSLTLPFEPTETELIVMLVAPNAPFTPAE
jgi:hypothetical protein